MKKGYEREREFESFEFNEEKEKRARIRYVDFQRVESTQHGQPLTPFELEVLEIMTSSPSPFDILTQRTEKQRRQFKRMAACKKLQLLVKRAGLNGMQMKCLQLVYLQGLSSSKAAKRLKITRCAVRWYIREIMEMLKNAGRSFKP